MYALVVHVAERVDLFDLDWKIRAWLGRYARSESWETAWTSHNRSCPAAPNVTSNHIRVFIEDDDDLDKFKEAWTPWVDDIQIIGHYKKQILLEELQLSLHINIFPRRPKISIIDDFILSNYKSSMWTNGFVLYYSDDSELVHLKLALSN